MASNRSRRERATQENRAYPESGPPDNWSARIIRLSAGATTERRMERERRMEVAKRKLQEVIKSVVRSSVKQGPFEAGGPRFSPYHRGGGGLDEANRARRECGHGRRNHPRGLPDR